MKIQSQVSISNQSVSQASEAKAKAQTQETQKAQQPSQVAASQKQLTESERNQRVSEFKAQEQLVRASLKQQVQETFPGLEKQPIGKLDQNMGGRRPGPREMLAWYRRTQREILRDGESLDGRFNRKDLPFIDRQIREIQQRLYNRALRELMNSPTHDVLQKGGSEGPTSDFSSDPMNPGGPGEQNPIMPGGGQQGGPSTGLQPGQGGTLNSPGGQGRSETGGSNQQVNPGSDNNGDDSNDGGKINGGNQGDNNKEGGGVGPRGSDNTNYGKRTAEPEPGGDNNGEDDDGGDGSGGYENDYRDPNTGIQVVSPEGQAPGETPGLPPDDGSQRGDDLKGKISGKKLPRGVTQKDVDFVGSAFGTTTGADDKERPNTGATSGTVAGDPMESRADDVGGRRLRSSGGRDIGVNAGEELLKRLGLWERPGGPDPEK